jgi:hypothetical protein
VPGGFAHALVDLALRVNMMIRKRAGVAERKTFPACMREKRLRISDGAESSERLGHIIYFILAR